MEAKTRKVWIENAKTGAPDSGFTLIDPLRLVSDPLPVSRGQLAAFRLMNGKRKPQDIRTALGDEHGVDMSVGEIKDFIQLLDKRGWLDSDRFRGLLRRSAEEYRQLESRPYLFQGESYPADAEELERLMGQSETPQRLRAAAWREVERGPIAGIVAPHIDPSRAGDAYADAYVHVPIDASYLFVILGTAHVPGDSRFILTTKDFRTPYGTLYTDVNAVNRATKLASTDLLQDEVLHRTEHSIEFQALYLSFRFRWARQNSIRILPVLIGSFADFIRAQRYPGDIPEVRSVFDALRQVIDERERSGERVIVLTGADLSHVGDKFGDSGALTPERLAAVEQADRTSLQHLLHLDARALYSDLARDGNARRWCGLAPLVCLLEILQADSASLLCYGKDYQPDANYAVTYSAISLHREAQE